MARLLRIEGLKTSDLMEATARRSASPRITVRSTLAASLLAKKADLSAPENCCLLGFRVTPGGAFGLGRAMIHSKPHKTKPLLLPLASFSSLNAPFSVSGL